jgi:predicted transcriptional regulator YdeE
MRIVAFPRAKVIGRAVRFSPPRNPVPDLWEGMEKEGVLAQLAALPGRLFPEAAVGWMGEYDPAERSFTYLAGILCESEQEVPEGMRAVEVPECTMAIGTVPEGPGAGHHANAAAYTERGYAAADLDFELEWFEGTKESGTFRYCSPVKKA